MSDETHAIKFQQDSKYSPLQRRQGIVEPQAEDFPPALERVSQSVDPFNPPYLDQREVLRVTYQGDDRCQLACPGCYTGERLTISVAEVMQRGGRKVVPHDEFIGQLKALGEGLQDFFLIGAEPTMDPEASAAKLRYVSEVLGLPNMSITNGAVRRKQLMDTFGEALEAGTLYKLNVSLDSIDPEINNKLRGRTYAFHRTLESIKYLIEIKAPLKVQMTVWALNYTTIMDSVQELYSMGVRAFAFHSGSIEGVDNPERHGLGMVDPLAWRALAEELLRFKNEHPELEHFNIPFLYFTKEELRDRIIGDEDLTDAYLNHVNAMEGVRPTPLNHVKAMEEVTYLDRDEAMNEGLNSTKPVHVCPALAVPQVYIYGNDGPEGNGIVSTCNIFNIGAYADYKPDKGRWEVVQDPERNQLSLMLESPHLCPATPLALSWPTDKAETEAGPLFAACRYVGSNQMPVDSQQFGLYQEAMAYYIVVRLALESYPEPTDADGEWPLQRIERVTSGAISFAERTELLKEDLMNL